MLRGGRMNILAVGCHPDDLEIGCGGTLARFAQEGHRVTMVHVANGNMGHVQIPPDELRLIRRKEAEQAANILGAAEIFSLDIGDLVVDANHLATISRMVALIRDVQPDVIITHAPEDYMKDHVEVSKLVFDASFSASVPHFADSEPRGIPDPLPAAKITPLYYMDTLAGVNFLPVEYVDIRATIEIKLKALDCHASQVKWMLAHDGIDFLDFVRTTAKFRGLQCGAAYAEGFRPCQTWPRLTTRRWLP
jgi:N-acetylglucosamine malate deacetylase 1